MLAVTVLALISQACPRPLAAQDTTALRREARRAAADYERALRRSAPYRVGGGGGHCDEIVGRFCLTYDAGTSSPLPPEPEPIKQARARAIEIFERALQVWPADTLIAGPLLRYLIEDNQGEKAVEAAARFSAHSKHAVWPHLMNGFALHAAERHEEAERAYQLALEHMDAKLREEWHDVRVLLEPEERSRYDKLTPDLRSHFHARLWDLADPLYLTRGNESRVEHFSRHVYGRILRRAPFATGAVSWGDDVEELTLRFGVPRMRTQDFARPMSTELPITEHFDPDQQTYVPPALLSAPGIKPFEPAAGWPYDTIRSRNGYAPRSVRRMFTLDHVLSRFHDGDSMIVRVDAELPVDSVVRFPIRLEVGVFQLDSTFRLVSSSVDTLTIDSAPVRARMVVKLAEGAFAYSVEARELESRLAWRARHWLPQSPAANRPLLSDLVVLSPSESGLPTDRESPAFTPLRSLKIKRGLPVVIYLESTGLTPNDQRLVQYTVDLEVMEESRPGVFSRTVKRLGQALGLGGDDVSPRITFSDQKPAAAVVPIALNLGKLQLDDGLKRFRVTVTDRETGVKASVDRVIRIEAK